MPDSFEQIRSGEKRPFYGQITVDSGTVTISGSPTCSLYDSDGVAVNGFSNVAVSGYDATALSNPRAWYDLDTVSLPLGYYTLVFTIAATGSDTLARVYEPSVEIHVVDAKL